MKHNDVTSGYPISIDYHRLTNYQRDPRNKDITCVSYPPSDLKNLNTPPTPSSCFTHVIRFPKACCIHVLSHAYQDSGAPKTF